MKRFAFRLESVLHVRRIEEDQSRARLIIANRDVALATQRVAERQLRYDSLERPLGTTDHDSLQRAWFALDAAAGAVRHAYAHQVDAEAHAEQLRDEFVECRRRTEVLERLRVRDHDQWRTEVRRAEVREIDDLVVARHRHQLLEGTR